MSVLHVRQVGPQVTVQDLGRPDVARFGLSRGGAADRSAFIEGAALLRQGLDCAALELAGFGGAFEVSAPARIALTGAPMAATLDGRALTWNASHAVAPGQQMRIGAATRGTYGYLHVGGGIDVEPFMDSRSTHLACQIGTAITVGAELPIGRDGSGAVGLHLPEADRYAGGEVRILPSTHFDRFSPEMRARFEATEFQRTPRGNRQGAELAFEGAPFASDDQLSILSEPVLPGDIQMTGDGVPFVLLPECQTTGGYPRLACVLPEDLPRVVQARPKMPLRFRFVSYDAAMASYRSEQQQVQAAKTAARPLLRNPAEMADLLAYQLIDGVVDARE